MNWNQVKIPLVIWSEPCLKNHVLLLNPTQVCENNYADGFLESF